MHHSYGKSAPHGGRFNDPPRSHEPDGPSRHTALCQTPGCPYYAIMDGFCFTCAEARDALELPRRKAFHLPGELLLRAHRPERWHV